MTRPTGRPKILETIDDCGCTLRSERLLEAVKGVFVLDPFTGKVNADSIAESPVCGMLIGIDLFNDAREVTTTRYGISGP